MGTSASGKGPKSNSPLVPAMSDATPNVPLPEPAPQRFESLSDRIRPRSGRRGRGFLFGPPFARMRAKLPGAPPVARGASGSSAYVAGARPRAGVDQSTRRGRSPKSNRIRSDPSLRSADRLCRAGVGARALAPENADAELVATAIQRSRKHCQVSSSPIGGDHGRSTYPPARGIFQPHYLSRNHRGRGRRLE